MVVRLTVQLYTFTRCLYVQTDPPRVVLKTQQSHDRKKSCIKITKLQTKPQNKIYI